MGICFSSEPAPEPTSDVTIITSNKDYDDGEENILPWISRVMVAASLGKTETLKNLLASVKDVNKVCNRTTCLQKGTTPLHAAAHGGYFDIIDYLLSTRNADPNVRRKDGRTPMHDCFSAEAIELLHEYGADITATDKEGNTPLHTACTRGKLANCETYVRLGADISAVNKRGNTPLHVACDAGMLESVHALLEVGGSDLVNIRNKYTKEMPVHRCCNSQTIEVLVEYGANITKADKEGNTPLHTACSRGHLDAVEALVRLGGSELLNHQNKMGKTPFHLAMETSNAELATFLDQQGEMVDRTLKDKKGKTAMDIGRQHKDQRFREICARK